MSNKVEDSLLNSTEEEGNEKDKVEYNFSDEVNKQNKDAQMSPEDEQGCLITILGLISISIVIYFIRFGARIAEYDEIHVKRAFNRWLNGYGSFERVFDQFVDFTQAILIIGLWTCIPIFIIGLTIAVVHMSERH